jgi:CRISPR-associated protein Csd1
MQKLHETYEANAIRPRATEKGKPLLPVRHTLQQAHIEIVLDDTGTFQRAQVIDGVETIIPATEKSESRTHGAPHGLCDKIQYVAADYAVPHGGAKEPYFEFYRDQLEAWCGSHPHPKAQAVLRYVKMGRVVADLIAAGILSADDSGSLHRTCPDVERPPEIFRVLPSKKEAGELVQDQGDAFVRWRVETPGVALGAVWEDESLIRSWKDFQAEAAAERGLCLVTGQDDVFVAKMHPKRIRHGADGAKLISSNDETGYTFRGRFVQPGQVATVSSEVTQKAHSALRWLIDRQGHRNGSQVVVAWAVSGNDVPDPLADSDKLFSESKTAQGVTQSDDSPKGDAGQAFALRLKKVIAGYAAVLGPTDDIVVITLDSATPGRMAVVYYRELTGSEFLERLQDWHLSFAWFQNFSKQLKFIGAPAPKDIASACYGSRMDDKLSRATVERLLPCIIDGRTVPRDLVWTATRRAGQRISMEWWEWEKSLGIACSLFRGFHQNRRYEMTLEPERTTRDYLYGRLLAIAEQLESRALFLAEENRDTTAARLMHRFADRPYSTWLTISTSLQPYKSRLQAKRPGYLFFLNCVLDEVHSLFDRDDFVNDKPLSGEYLLAYHCQRRDLIQKPETTDTVNRQDGESEE